MEVTEEIKNATIVELIEYISWKEEYPSESKAAFNEFFFRFEGDLKKMAEIACLKWKYSETVALDIVKCTLNRVWKYPTFDPYKSKAKTPEKGVKLWLHKIVYTQLANYHNKGFCHEPDKETDLSLIYTIDDLAENIATSKESKDKLVLSLQIVEKALSKLSDKHKTIYLTYKLYSTNESSYIPRIVSKKLQDQLGLVPASIRKYKQEANQIVELFLTNFNG